MNRSFPFIRRASIVPGLVLVTGCALVGSGAALAASAAPASAAGPAQPSAGHVVLDPVGPLTPRSAFVPDAHPVAPSVHTLALTPSTGAAASGALASGAAAAARAGGTAAEAPSAATVLTPQRTVAPFDLVALTWPQGQDVHASTFQARVREGGRWSGWEDLGIEDAVPDPGSLEQRASARRVGTGPLLTEHADGLQVRVLGHAPTGMGITMVDAGHSAADAELPMPQAAASPSAGQLLSAQAAGQRPAAAQRALAQPAAPTVITRAQWGADESLRSGTPVYNRQVKALILHHTAGSNSYSASGAASQIRAIYAYHTKVLGWSDIGYNLVLDRYGRVYEGRRGSITAMVMGAHAGGFNVDTYGISTMGNFDVASPPTALLSGIEQVMAWKAAQFGINPRGTTTLVSAGGGYTKYPFGAVVTKYAISGHRDVDLTECPGRYLYATLGTIRSAVATLMAGSHTAPPSPTPSPTPTPPPASLVPASFNLIGAGSGDGVGMPRYGAYARALAGQNESQIMAAYFPGSRPGVGAYDDRVVRTSVAHAGSSVKLQVIRRSGDTSMHARLRLSFGRVATYVPPLSIVELRPSTVGSGLAVYVNGALRWPNAGGPGRVNLVTDTSDRHYGGQLQVIGTGLRGLRAVYLSYGFTEVSRVGDGVEAVAVQRVADYLRGVVTMPFSWAASAPRALVAQAVVARSYAVAASQRPASADCGCQLHDGGTDPAYDGYKLEGASGYSAWDSALRRSADVAISGGGHVVATRWFASSGGWTLSGAQGLAAGTLGADDPMLVGVSDPWSVQLGQPFRTWTKTVPQATMARAFGLSDVKTVSTTLNGGLAVATATATARSGASATLTGRDLAARLGLPSTWVALAG